MKTKFINWIKWKIAGEELEELYRIKVRAEEVNVWCSHLHTVREASSYILKGEESYPYQCFGYHGSIEDFRRYIEKISKEKKL